MSKRWPKWMPDMPLVARLGLARTHEFRYIGKDYDAATREAKAELLAWYDAARKADPRD